MHDRRKGRGDRDGRYPSGSLVKVKKDPGEFKPTIKPKSEAANGADRLDGKGIFITNTCCEVDNVAHLHSHVRLTRNARGWGWVRAGFAV